MKNVIIGSVTAAIGLAFTAQVALADTSYGSYVSTPAKFVGKTLFMPLRIFHGSGSEPRIVAVQSSQVMTGSPLGAGPGIVVTRTTGEQAFVSSQMVAYGPLFVTTGATIVGFTTWLPNDLATRRDDLTARIYVEKAAGKLSDTQTNNLLAEVITVASHFNAGDECITSHAKLVNHMYKDFDRVSNDIYQNSKQGDRQLAGRYSFISSR